MPKTNKNRTDINNSLSGKIKKESMESYSKHPAIVKQVDTKIQALEKIGALKFLGNKPDH
jgi:hypothetical protein